MLTLQKQILLDQESKKIAKVHGQIVISAFNVM